MALEPIVENLDSVDEVFREHYVEDSEAGGYRLDVTPKDGYVLENVNALKDTLTKVRGEVRIYEKKYKSIADKYGDLDPEVARDAMTRLEELSKFDPQSEAEKLAEQKYETQKKRLETSLNKSWEERISKEYEPIKNKYSAMEAQLRKQMVTNEAIKAIAKEEGDADLLLPHVTSRIKFHQNEDGNFETTVVDADGETPLYNNKAQPMSAHEFVASLKDKFPGAFKAKGKPGGGAKPSGSQDKDIADFGELLKNARPGERLV